MEFTENNVGVQFSGLYKTSAPLNARRVFYGSTINEIRIANQSGPKNTRLLFEETDRRCDLAQFEITYVKFNVERTGLPTYTHEIGYDINERSWGRAQPSGKIVAACNVVAYPGPAPSANGEYPADHRWGGRMIVRANFYGLLD